MLPLVAAAKAGEIALKNIRLNNFNSVLVCELFLQHPRQLAVDFDGDDLLGSSRQEFGHRTTPRADLADQTIGPDRQGLDDPPLKPPVAEEMLA
jgi:hypothetical protein